MDPRIRIRPAQSADVPALLAIQRRAFTEEADIYAACSIPPLEETEAQVQEALAAHTVLLAEFEGQVAGSVRGQWRGRTCYVGRLAVDPDLQGRGIGGALMAAIEAAFADAERFELATGHESMRNLAWYRRLGYREFRRKRQNANVILVYMEKPAAALCRTAIEE